MTRHPPAHLNPPPMAPEPFGELVAGAYHTIVADPPWRYRATTPTTSALDPAGAESKYSTMAMPDIAALPVADLASPTACLFLWVTNPRLFGDRTDNGASPLGILEAWGFTYVTMVTWVKTGRLGLGHYFRGQTEHALVGVRGGFAIDPDRRERNVIEAAATGHSVKPAAFYDMVERVCPGPYLELFARQPRLGWEHWGRGYEASR